MGEVGHWPAYLVATGVVRIVSSISRKHWRVDDFVPYRIAQLRAIRIRRAALGLPAALVGAISPASVVEAGEGASGGVRIPPPLLPEIGAHDFTSAVLTGIAETRPPTSGREPRLDRPCGRESLW
jgi:hypothetical protein